MRIITWSLICGLFLSAVEQAQEASWEPVKALNADTPLIIEEHGGRRVHGRWEAADDTKVTVKVAGQSLAIPRAAVVEVDRVIPQRHFDGKRALIGFAIGAALAEILGRSTGSELAGTAGGAHTRAVNRSAVSFGLIGAAIGVSKGMTKKDDHMVVYHNPQP